MTEEKYIEIISRFFAQLSSFDDYTDSITKQFRDFTNKHLNPRGEILTVQVGSTLLSMYLEIYKTSKVTFKKIVRESDSFNITSYRRADKVLGEVLDDINHRCENANFDIIDGKVKYKLTNLKKYNAINTETDTVENALKRNTMLLESVVVMMCNEFDYFMEQVFEVLFENSQFQKQLNEKQISFKALSDSQSLESAKKIIIEKAVDGIMRKGLSEWFKCLNKLGVKNISSETGSIEMLKNMFKQRNAIVHNGGWMVKENEQRVKKEKVNIDSKYIKKMIFTMGELAVLISHSVYTSLRLSTGKLSLSFSKLALLYLTNTPMLSYIIYTQLRTLKWGEVPKAADDELAVEEFNYYLSKSRTNSVTLDERDYIELEKCEKSFSDDELPKVGFLLLEENLDEAIEVWNNVVLKFNNEDDKRSLLINVAAWPLFNDKFQSQTITTFVKRTGITDYI